MDRVLIGLWAAALVGGIAYSLYTLRERKRAANNSPMDGGATPYGESRGRSDPDDGGCNQIEGADGGGGNGGGGNGGGD